MNLIISILAIYGLLFLIKETDGPFGIIGYVRNLVMRLPFIGIFFFKLLECPFCLGCHCGWIVYLLNNSVWQWNQFLLWVLAGGSIGLITHLFILKLSENK